MVNTGMPAAPDEDVGEAREIEAEVEITLQMGIASNTKIRTTTTATTPRATTTRLRTTAIHLNQCRRRRTWPRPSLTRNQIFNILKIRPPTNLRNPFTNPLDRLPINLSPTTLQLPTLRLPHPTLRNLHSHTRQMSRTNMGRRRTTP
jgi:hypothetical protein